MRAAAIWSSVWNWVPVQISQRSGPEPHRAAQRLHRRVGEVGTT